MRKRVAKRKLWKVCVKWVEDSVIYMAPNKGIFIPPISYHYQELYKKIWPLRPLSYSTTSLT